MFWLKACPKCHGDLYTGKDTYGPFISCMQCSRYLTPAEEADLLLVTAKPDMWHNSIKGPEKEMAA